LDWIHELVDWIGLGQQKWTRVQLCSSMLTMLPYSETKVMATPERPMRLSWMEQTWIYSENEPHCRFGPTYKIVYDCVVEMFPKFPGDTTISSISASKNLKTAFRGKIRNTPYGCRNSLQLDKSWLAQQLLPVYARNHFSREWRSKIKFYHV